MQHNASDKQAKTGGRMYSKPIAHYSSAEIGCEGENIAKQYLAKRGYAIRSTNLKIAGVEIDIIADSNQNDTCNTNNLNETVLIEVKTRVCLHKEDADNYPEYAVDERKQRRYAKAAKAFETCFDCAGPVRFDVISVQIMSEDLARIHHMIGAFEVDEQ